MNISDWVSLGASAGALSASLIALFSYKELIRQRKSSYKPELCILNSKFEFNYKVDSNFPLGWSSKNKSASLPAVNIGLGAAKNVSIEWVFDVNNAVKIVSKLLVKHLPDFTIENNDHYLTITSGKSHDWVMNAAESKSEFILPINHENDATLFSVPPSLVALMNLHTILQVKNGVTLDNVEHLDVYANVKYFDIGGDSYMKKFRFSFNFCGGYSKGSEEVSYKFIMQNNI